MAVCQTLSYYVISEVIDLNWFETLNPIIQALIATTFTWGVTALRFTYGLFF